METTQIRRSGNSSGFKMYGVVKDIIKYGERDALLLEKISGKQGETKEQFIAMLEINPDYKGKQLDAEGLTSLKIKKGINVGLQQARYLAKAEQDKPAVLEARRINRVGRDFRPDQTLVVASFGADTKNLRGYVVVPQKGIYGEAPENKAETLTAMLNETIDKLNDEQGIMVLINTRTQNGDPITVHHFISRYHKDSDDAESVQLTLDQFRAKVTEFLEGERTVIDFLGLQRAPLRAALNGKNSIRIAVVPGQLALMSQSKHWDKGYSTVQVGPANVGVGIDPGNADRPYPIIQVASMEMIGVLGYRYTDSQTGKPVDKVRSPGDDFIFNRLTGQIDMLNDRAPTPIAPTSKSVDNTSTNSASTGAADNAPANNSNAPSDNAPANNSNAPSDNASSSSDPDDAPYFPEFDEYDTQDPFDFAPEEDDGLRG